MHPLFPYLVGALSIGAFGGLVAYCASVSSFRDDMRAEQSAAAALCSLDVEKLRERLFDVEQLTLDLKDAGQRRDLALERHAGELMQHRLSAPPPRLFASGRRPVQTSQDWDDSYRATLVRPSQPPPLPAFPSHDTQPDFGAQDVALHDGWEHVR
jgi:hypothetical protein